MPYYKWQAVDLSGALRSGYQRALSLEELECDLIARDLGLLKAQPKKVFFSAVQEAHIIFFFQRISALVSAGVRLHEALKIVIAKTRSHRLADVIEQVYNDVERGVFFHDALAKHPRVFEPLMIHMWRVAHEGKLVEGIALLCIYLEERSAIRKKLRKAASMPALTGVFFIIIMMAVLVGIIPRFAELFSSLNVELPVLTKKLLYVSTAIQQTSMSVVLAGVIMLILILQVVSKNTWSGSLFGRGVLRIPYVNSFIIERDLCIYFKALAILLKARMPLDQALELAASVIQNGRIRKTFTRILQHVREGTSLDQALEHTSFIDTEIVALIAVGLRSGRLADLVMEVGALSHERMTRRISFLIYILQPLLLLVLAGCIVGLMLAVYVPILTFSHSIS